MKRFAIIGCVVVAVAVLAAVAWHSSLQQPLATVPAGISSSSSSSTLPASLPTTTSATLVIFDGTKNIFDGAVPVGVTSTVFDVLASAAASSGFAFAYQNYPGMGFLITKIGDKINGTGSAYWQYWVNGTYAEEGASHVAAHAHDLIEWKFISSQP